MMENINGKCTKKQENDTHSDIAKIIAMAKSGDMRAQCNLGWCYGYGIGVEKDHSKALFWYQKAAEQGHDTARKRLQILCHKDNDVKQSGLDIVYKENNIEPKKNPNSVQQKIFGISKVLLDKMKEEAIKRMIVLRIQSSVIYKFAENGTRYMSLLPKGSYHEVDIEKLMRIKEFEIQNHVLVYLIIRSRTDDCLVDNYLYVSDNVLNWSKERAAIENESSYAYIENNNNSTLSKFDVIGIKRTASLGLLRTW